MYRFYDILQTHLFDVHISYNNCLPKIRVNIQCMLFVYFHIIYLNKKWIQLIICRNLICSYSFWFVLKGINKVILRIDSTKLGGHGDDVEHAYLVATSSDPRLVLSKESVVLISRESGFIFIQTDRPIYTPDQEGVHTFVSQFYLNLKLFKKTWYFANLYTSFYCTNQLSYLLCSQDSSNSIEWGTLAKYKTCSDRRKGMSIVNLVLDNWEPCFANVH